MAITVPTYDVPDVEPNYARPATADYGAGPGRAVEQLGATASAASDQLYKQVMALQEQQDSVVAQQKYMAAQQKATTDLYGENGILAAQGVNAQGMTKRAIDYLNATLQDSLQGANPRQQRMIQGLWDRYSVGRVESAAQHELSQHQQTMATTGQAMIQNAQDQAAHDPANDKSVIAAASAAADAFEASSPGASPAVIAAGRAAAASGAYKAAILNRSQTDPMGAAAMLQTYAPQLYGQDLLQAQEHLRPLIQKARIDAFGASLINGTADSSADAVAARIPQVESGGRQMDPVTGGPVTSAKGAIGKWQVEPDTGRAMAAKLGVPWDESRFHTDAGYNEQLGRAYFNDNLQRYGGNTLLAAAAYNAGPGRVDQWIKDIGDPRTGAISGQDFAARIPIAETRDYVRKVGAVPGGPPSTGYFAVGDSIGQGLAQAGKLPGPAIQNATPYEVKQQIDQLTPAEVRGKTILLSSGVSNNPAAIGLVDQQIADLKAKGAAEVRLVGVGTRDDFAGLNEKLAAAASRAGATFTGPLDPGTDKVHPKNYPALLASVQGSGPASAVRPPAPPNLQDMLAKADRAAADDPDPGAQMRYEAKAREVYSRWEAQTRVQRADLQRSIGGMNEALEAGVDVPIPELQIRSLLPPEQANEELAKLNISQIAGQALKSVDLASPDEINATIKDLSSGLGRFSQAIRVRGGALSGPGMVTGSDQPAGDGVAADVAAGSAGAGATASLAAGINAVPGESATQFALRRRVLSSFVSLLAKRQTALTDDPAAYVAARDPIVASRLQALQNNPGDAGAQQAYEGALVAQQQALGVSQPRLLSNAQVAQQVQTLTQLDPAKDSVTGRLDAMAKQFGDSWPQAFGELVKVGKLNPQYQTLATMTEPGQLVARDDFQRALGMISEDKGGFERLRKAAPSETSQYIDGAYSNLDTALAGFRRATAFSSGGIDLFENVRNSVRTLAYYYATRDGLDGGAAVTKAADAILGQKYDPPSGNVMLAPKGTMDQVQSLAGNTLSQLKAEELQPFNGYRPGLTGGVAPDWQTKFEQFQRSGWKPTELSPEDEAAFKGQFVGTPFFRGIKSEMEAGDHTPLTDDQAYSTMTGPGADYDYRGAWKAGAQLQVNSADGRIHWPDEIDGRTFKSPDHPTAWMGFFENATGKDPDELGLHTLAEAKAWTERNYPGGASDRQNITYHAAQNGFWVPNQGGTGLVLMANLKDLGASTNSGAVPVKRADGSPVQIMFGDKPPVLNYGPAPVALDSAP